MVVLNSRCSAVNYVGADTACVACCTLGDGHDDGDWEGPPLADWEGTWNWRREVGPQMK